MQRLTGLRVDRRDRRAVPVLAGVALLVYLAAFYVINQNGYGENLDNYTMLRSWQVMVAQGVYIPSRFQGNLPSELALGYFASWFGPTGANGLSLVLSIVALAGFYALLKAFCADRFRLALAILTVGLNPFWVNAASTSMDYVHPIAFSLIGVLCLRRNYPALGAVLLAVASGCRLSYGPVGLGALVLNAVLRTEKTERSGALQAVAVYLVVTGLIYLPVFISSHLSLQFLGSASPNWQGIPGLLARGVYKQIYLYGVLGTAIIVGGIVMRLGRGAAGATVSRNEVPHTRLFRVACWAIIVYHSLLFFYIPIRIEYLLPSSFAFAGLCLTYGASRLFLGALVVAEFVYWFGSIDLLRVEHRYEDPCAAVQAMDAHFSPHIVPGVLLPRFQHDTIEATCMPIRLLERPADIHDRLPRPKPQPDAPSTSP